MEFFLRGKGRRYLLLLIDYLSVFVTSYISVTVLHNLNILNIDLANIFVSLLFFSLFCIIGMVIMRVYKIVWRYSQPRNFMNCFVGVFLGYIMFSLLLYLYSKSAIEISYLFSALASSVAVCFTRAFYAGLCQYIAEKTNGLSTNNVMIVGAGEGGRHICNIMKTQKEKFNPVVFIDDDSNKIGRWIDNVLVKGNTNEIPKIVKEDKIKEIVFAIPSIDPAEKTRILNICSETLCKVSVLPDINGYVHSDSLNQQMKPIKIEDLLGRDVVSLDNEETHNMISGSVCMITGGGGSIGSELSRQVAAMNPKRLIIVDIYENNAYNIQQELKFKYGDSLDLCVEIASVRDIVKLESLFVKYKPQILFHAAAHKHVPLMETNPEEAVKNNIFGTLNTATLAKKYNAEKFVLVSTDKAVNPTNIMGATKRCCEMIVECFAQSGSNTEFVAVRFGNVLGSNGSVIPLFEKQIAQGGPVTVTDPKIIRYFMTIPEAASLILQAATMARGGEIFVLDMGQPVKILKLAENLIRLHGMKPYDDIEIRFTGLRPGEKLYEELLMNEEGLKNTANNKIFIGQQIEINEKEFYENLEKLKNVAEHNDKEEVENLMKIIVPTFKRREETANK